MLNEDGSVEWAYRENVYIVPSSIGGNTSGVQIPFTIYNAGNRVSGTFNTATNTFSESAEESICVYLIDGMSEDGLQYNTPQISYEEGYLTFESQELSFSYVYVNPVLRLEQLPDSKKSDSTTLYETLIADSRSTELNVNALIITDNGDGTAQYMIPPDLITGNIYMFVTYI